jgi:hypothetical protein
MTDCIAVFTSPEGHTPLDVAAGGWTGRSKSGKFEGSMLLRVGSTWYRQDTRQPVVEKGSAPFPYPETDFVRTSWKQWRDKHAGTDVYIGEGRAAGTAQDVEEADCEVMN